MSDRTALCELNRLISATYQLWDEEWVGFSWRNYTPCHVARVRNLARTIGKREGADRRVLEFAALLHDITKPFDGEILVKDGSRVLDENGFWKNEVLLPARRNAVTDLYLTLGLAGTLHNTSGAAIAEKLLKGHAYPDSFCSAVARAIVGHLSPNGGGIESQVLYDADTIDANVGLPAFHRNINIYLHNQDKQYANQGRSFPTYLKTNLRQFLGSYLQERVPAWNEGKNRDFVCRLTTAAGREMAQARVERLSGMLAVLARELDQYEEMIVSGGLAVVRYFFEHRSNPKLDDQLDYLQNTWLQSNSCSSAAIELLEWFRREVEGLA